MQTAVAPNVLRSDDNLVVASPTASGKTVIFELALVRMLETCPNGKALFLVPMKSICSERHADWSVRFASHGLEVMMLTGDTDSPDEHGPKAPREIIEGLERANVIVATTEKWDGWTRTHRNTDSVIGQIALLCVDEVHVLGERRGPVIEAVVSRMRMISLIPELAEQPISRLRVIALSATLANPQTLCAWLGEESTIVHNFDSSFRPTPLSVTVTGFRSSIPARFEQDTLLPALPNTIREHTSGRPTLVFFPSRQLTEDGALKLAGSNVCSPSAEATKAANDKALCLSTQLTSLLRAGVATHVASMTAEERRVVETLFAEGHLSVLCATTGLSLGVNLPAHLVVICGTTRWGGSTEGYVEYTNSDILQMAGRAGRPGFDTEGKCVVLTTEANAARYTDLIKGVMPICSQLHKHLCEYLNAEINTASYMTSADVALGFLKGTFLYKCALDANLRHNLELARDADQQDIDGHLQRLCADELRRLDEAGLIRLSDAGAIEPQPAGRICAIYSVRFHSMALITAELTASTTVEELIGILARCEELHDPLRRAERIPLFDLHKVARYPCMDAKQHVSKVGNVPLKTSVLLQAACSGEVPVGKLLAAYTLAAKEGRRLLVAIIELAQERGFFDSLLHAHTLARCLARGAGWGDSPNKVLAQLPNVGEVLADRLVAAGLKTIKAVAKATPVQLECSCLKTAPFGDELKAAAMRVPEISVWARRDDVAADSEAGGTTSRISVGMTCVCAPSTYDWRNMDAKFTLLVGSPLNPTLVLRKSLRLYEKDKSVSFVLPPRVSTMGAGPLRICLLHDFYVGADVEACLQPAALKPGVQVGLELKAMVAAAPPPPARAPPQKPATKPRKEQQQVAATPCKRARSAVADPSMADDQWYSPPSVNAGQLAHGANRGAAPVCEPLLRTPAAAPPPPSHQHGSSRSALQEAMSPTFASTQPAAIDDAVNAFFEQFQHTNDDKIDTPPSKQPLRASRLAPPRDAGASPRLLGGLATHASCGNSARDLIAQLRSSMSTRAQQQPPMQRRMAALGGGQGYQHGDSYGGVQPVMRECNASATARTFYEMPTGAYPVAGEMLNVALPNTHGGLRGLSAGHGQLGVPMLPPYGQRQAAGDGGTSEAMWHTGSHAGGLWTRT